MAYDLIKTKSDFTRRNGNWVLLLASLGFTGYGAYKAIQSPTVITMRKRLLNLAGAFMFVAEAMADTAQTLGVVSKDLKEFVLSDSDFVPNSFRQITKIARSDDVSDSVVRITRALTLGIMKGYRSEIRRGEIKPGSGLSDRLFDRLFSTAGSGFASIVVGSFAKNLVTTFYSVPSSDSESDVKWVNVVCDEKCKELIGNCVKMFVGTAVASYLDRTIDINPFDEIFSGLTNPKHDTKMKELLSSICNGAVKSFVTTTNQVLTGSETRATAAATGLNKTKLMVEVTGKMTFETVRSFLEFLLEKILEGIRKSFELYEMGIEKGFEKGGEVVDEMKVKTTAVFTIWISLCLNVLGSVWIMVPPA
ncbi:protein PHLOEM PROTEIN 2-LIKE A10-like [Impatiens glandulifera]|uniref:protein PHLOEM PROTEIN 2-LIKE A10-like n=1 Tax=Impatiens glandulifera TaxID=253017 RepID=UPI001FB17967|nr:protein PHLOEM PROTEIN 2-LIKE A10-like [Impatiens glandulifera]